MIRHFTRTRWNTPVRALATVLAIGVMSSPALVAAPSQAGSDDPMWRKVSAPNVFFPVAASSSVKDLRTSRAKHAGTDIQAPCNQVVYAAHPGRVLVNTNLRWAGANLVRVVSNTRGLVTGYAYLSSALVQHGQIVQSGQPIGYVGTAPKTGACGLYFSVTRNGRRQNATWWLNRYVGQAPPTRYLFDTPGFNLASFNVLGASHTRKSSRYATYPQRTNRAISLLDSRGLDVVGLQEFQEIQSDYFMKKTGGTWGIFHWDPAGKRRDTENAIIWRKSTMEFVSGETFDIPYFNGNIRHVPAVLLREKATGRTAYFLNVHNPANVRGNAAGYRARAVAIEKQKMIDLRATGRPVFLTGDFNDRAKAFCPLTQDKLSISPNSVPSMTCAYPKQTSIDWIFAAGQARFSSFSRDTYPQSARISDHPLVVTRTHLQD